MACVLTDVQGNGMFSSCVQKVLQKRPAMRAGNC